MRLGRTARLRDVDPLGRLGFVTHWRRPPRLFDLRQLRWIDGPHLGRGVYLWNRKHPPRLTAKGRLIYGEWSPGSGYERTTPVLFDTMRVIDLRGDTSFRVHIDAPAHGTAVSPTQDIFYYATETQRVAVIHGARNFIVDPLPRKVVQSVFVDGERSLLVAASWSEIVVHRIVDDELQRVTRLQTELQGDIPWVAIAGPWLLVAIQCYAEPPVIGKTIVIEVRRFDDALTIGPVVHRHAGTQLRAASVSRDGRYFAAAIDDRLLVHELDTDTVTFFTEHTDKINLVRFAGDDHVLISADTDNRVVLRPRTETGYVRPLIEIEIPDEAVALPPLDAPIAVPR